MTTSIKILRLFWKIFRYVLGIFVFILIIRSSTLSLNNRNTAIAIQVSSHQFDYVRWEIGAIASKINQTLFGVHPFLTETDRVQFVRDYMATLAQAQSLEVQINTIYTDPAISNPDSESELLRQQRDHLRSELQAKQSLMEAILEGQVASVLVEQSFGTMGQLLPPISMRFTKVPNLLIVSPRDEIRFDVSINLLPLTIEEQNELENSLDTTHDVSSLIVPLGGIALYPAMILETSSIPFAIEVFAHEWLHHYLFAFPLGLHYFSADNAFAGETRIINETTADIFGKEIRDLVLLRYYPDLYTPPVPPPNPQTTTEPPIAGFQFGAEMNETRITVDTFLAEGKIEEAETYMEERRQVFVENGYTIRKINQAYFAFYGGYQAGDIPGIAGSDPIGPAIHSIREDSLTIHEFIVQMREITTREQLLDIAQVTEE